MKHIYISSIAILLLTPQLIFAAETVEKGYTQQEIENIKKYTEYRKNWRGSEGTAGYGHQLENQVKETEKLRTVPRPIQTLNQLEQSIKNNIAEIERLNRVNESSMNAARSLSEVRNGGMSSAAQSEAQNELIKNARQARLRIVLLESQNAAAVAQQKAINTQAKQVIAARPGPLPPPPKADPLGGTLAVKPKGGVSTIKPVGLGSGAVQSGLPFLLPYMIYQMVTTNIYDLENEISQKKRELKNTSRTDNPEKWMELNDSITDLEGEYAARYADALKEYGKEKIDENRMIRKGLIKPIY